MVSGLTLLVGIATALFWEGPLAVLVVGALLVAVLLLLAVFVALWLHRA